MINNFTKDIECDSNLILRCWPWIRLTAFKMLFTLVRGVPTFELRGFAHPALMYTYLIPAKYNLIVQNFSFKLWKQ